MERMTNEDIDRICRERMQPIMGRMDAMAKDNQRLRDGAAADAVVDERVVTATKYLKLKVDALEDQVRRFKDRAYRAERKLTSILNGELDPFDLMTPEQVEQREATGSLLDMDEALDQLPPEAVAEYERCQASIVEAQRSAQEIEGRRVIL